MSFSYQEKIGVIDLLQTHKQNVPILFQLSKSVTKNVVDVPTEQEALDTIFLHIPDCTTLLNKRLITKQILFKYLHKNKVPLTADFTKAQLVKKVQDYWYKTFGQTQTENKCTEINKRNANTEIHTSANGHTIKNPAHTVVQDSEDFPINLLARKFSEWFFDNYNKNALKINDFWSDACLLLEITANDGIDEQICEDSTSLLESLMETRQRFGFYFNPNLTHAGVQGRMDVHGLVLVLACGTLHTEKDCVGVFECVFGLLRDPFAENNWKSKNIKLILRSKGAPVMPSLEDSEALREALTLPVPHGELK